MCIMELIACYRSMLYLCVPFILHRHMEVFSSRSIVFIATYSAFQRHHMECLQARNMDQYGLHVLFAGSMYVAFNPLG